MAVFPCGYLPHRYPGPQRSAYITRFAGSIVQTRKLRLCQRHFDEYAQVIAKYLEHVSENSSMSVDCHICHEPYDEGISIRLFDQGEEPGVWAAEFCAGHAEHVADHALWATAMPL